MWTAESKPERALERKALQGTGLTSEFLHRVLVGSEERGHLRRKGHGTGLTQPQFLHVILVEGRTRRQFGQFVIREPYIERVGHVTGLAGLGVRATLGRGEY